MVLIQQNVECKSGDSVAGNFKTVAECFDAVRNMGGKFFIFGKGSKAGGCYRENTADEHCLEGWEADAYDFYKITNPVEGMTIVKTDAECKSDDDYMGRMPSIVACMAAVRDAGGRFFIYGKHDRAGACFKENTQTAVCPEGWIKKNYDFFKIDEPIIGMELVKGSAECQSSDDNMGPVATLGDCMEAVRAAGGKFFVYGKGQKKGACYRENTALEQCPEGWEHDQYDFFKVTAPDLGMTLIRANAECNSKDDSFGMQPSVFACMTVTRAAGGTFFIYGKGAKGGACFRENPKSEKCTEGFQKDSYDFFKVTPPPPDMALVKLNAECKSSDWPIGTDFADAKECMEAVKKNGGSFFIFGKGNKAHQCWQENTASESCPEGFQTDAYDFYKILSPGKRVATMILVKSNAMCRSTDDAMGLQPSVPSCMAAVKAAGVKFFLYGKGTKDGVCWKANTKTEDCPEGFDVDEYDFYKVEDILTEDDDWDVMTILMLVGVGASFVMCGIWCVFKRLVRPGATPPPLLG